MQSMILSRLLPRSPTVGFICAMDMRIVLIRFYSLTSFLLQFVRILLLRLVNYLLERDISLFRDPPAVLVLRRCRQDLISPPADFYPDLSTCGLDFFELAAEFFPADLPDPDADAGGLPEDGV